jgi:hypothetical protein
MGIKWADVKVLNSPLTGKICIGKLDKSGMIATDRSEDMTQVIITAVMIHMDFGLEKDAKGSKSESEAGTLYWIPKAGGYSVTLTKDEPAVVQEHKPDGFGDCKDGIHQGNIRGQV